MFWSDAIEMLRALIFGVAHVCNGSIGLAVILVSFAIRLALLPLTLRLARRAREHQRRMAELRPELERLQKRYANDPAALWRETSRFYKVRGVKQVDPAGLWGGLAQMPVFAALYSTLRNGLGSGIRFLWIGETALPNLLLTLIVAAITVGSISASQPADATRAIQVMSLIVVGGMTLWFLSSTSALFALSTGAGATVGALQGWILRREQPA
jgi:YidC/Oxa1 family membrane protein insertase